MNKLFNVDKSHRVLAHAYNFSLSLADRQGLLKLGRTAGSNYH